MSKFAALRGEEEWSTWLQVDRFGSILFREDHGLRRRSRSDAYKPRSPKRSNAVDRMTHPPCERHQEIAVEFPRPK